MKNKKSFLGVLLITLCISNNINSQNKNNLIKPNVIIFYADDLGWQDTQLNNLDEPSPWETPNIMKLSKDAINFTNGYSPAPTCAPSRCAILSGLHPVKTGITHVSGGKVPSPRYSNYGAPFFPAGLAPERFTIAEALKMNGYRTGHVGKWHLGHLESRNSKNQGFDFAHESRGAHQGPKKEQSRLAIFATHAKNDAYRLSDEKYPPFTKSSPNGISYPKDDVTENALKFINKNKNEPFFLYLAHWMVHSPIHTKNRELLQYYCDKLGVDFPEKDLPYTTGGQTNPIYGSMVTTLDWSLGRVVDLLKKTDDPRNPGKKLYETTYIIFSSDNGGVERVGKEIVTDNFPLDEGKKYAQEGGIRVPMLIAGPNVSKGKTYDGLINQLDFFPTIMNLTNSKIPAKYSSDFDGLDISQILQNNKKVVKNKNGDVREDLWWHFPHNQNHQMQSAIRRGDYKLYKNHIKGNYELYRLYNNGERADLEEKKNIAEESPEVLKDLSTRLEKYLKDYDAKYPYKDPAKTKDISEKENIASIPKVISHSFDRKSRKFSVKLAKGKSKVVECYGLVKLLGDSKGSKDGAIRRGKSPYVKINVTSSNNKLDYTLDVPEGMTEYGIIFIDENNFMVKSEFHKL